MMEQEWHKQVREEILEKYKKSGTRVEWSHGENPSRANCLSDADIVVFDSEGKITKVIEIESEPNPKKVMGVVIATHLCTLCKVKDERPYPLANILLEIIYRKSKAKSKKADKLAVMFEPLLEMVKNSKSGCLSSFRWEAHE